MGGSNRRRKAADTSPTFVGTVSPEVSMSCPPFCGVGLAVEDDASSWGYFDALTNSIHTRRALLPQSPSTPKDGLSWISESQAAVSIDHPQQRGSEISFDANHVNEETKSSTSDSATDEQQRIIALKLENAELQVRRAASVGNRSPQVWNVTLVCRFTHLRCCRLE